MVREARKGGSRARCWNGIVRLVKVSGELANDWLYYA